MKQLRCIFALGLLILAASTACATGGNQSGSGLSSTVTAADLAENPDLPVEIVLQRKVSGITLIRLQGGGVAIRIRGAVSLDGSNSSPLYVMDGVELATSPDGAMPMLNPRNIESIQVLKGAGTALYGIRGANGVILITSKR